MFFTTSNFSTNHSSTGLLSSNSDSDSSLLSDNSNNSLSSLLNPTSSSSIDTGYVGGKDILFGNPDMLNMDMAFVVSAPPAETAGSIAFGGIETAGSIAFGGVETAGSIACASGVETAGSVACGGGDSGGGGFSSFC